VLLVHAATSTTYPLSTADIFNHVYRFTRTHHRPMTLALRGGRPMQPGQRFDEAAWRRNHQVTFFKVALVSWICRCLLGQPRTARVLEAGWKIFLTINTHKYDLNLLFDTANLLRLEAALAPSERSKFFLVWRPPASSSSSSSSAAPAKVPLPGSAAGAGRWSAVHPGSGSPRPPAGSMDALTSTDSSSVGSSEDTTEAAVHLSVHLSAAAAAAVGGGAGGGGDSGQDSPSSSSTPKSGEGGVISAEAFLCGDASGLLLRGEDGSGAGAGAAVGKAQGDARDGAGKAAVAVTPLGAGLTWHQVQSNTMAYL